MAHACVDGIEPRDGSPYQWLNHLNERCMSVEWWLVHPMWLFQGMIVLEVEEVCCQQRCLPREMRRRSDSLVLQEEPLCQ